MLTFERLDDRGEPITGRYFERYWLPILGPTSTSLMRLLGEALRDGERFEIEPVELAGRLGVKPSTLADVLERLGRFGMVVGGQSFWQVRMAVTPLDARQERRLPAGLAQTHRELMALVG